MNTENISTEKHKQWLVTKERDYAHEEFQRTISRETKHTLYCFKNCGLLHLSTQTFPKNIIVNHLLNCENRRKSKRLPAQRRKNRSAICNDVIGQNWSRGPCPTPPGSRRCGSCNTWFVATPTLLRDTTIYYAAKCNNRRKLHY